MAFRNRFHVVQLLRWALAIGAAGDRDISRSADSSVPAISMSTASASEKSCSQRLVEALAQALNEHLLWEHYLPYESAQQLALVAAGNSSTLRSPDALNAIWWLEADDYSTLDFEAYVLCCCIHV